MKRHIALLLALATPAFAEMHADVAQCNDNECVGVTAELCMDNAEDGFDPEGIVRCIMRETRLWDVQMQDAMAQATTVMQELDDQDKTTEAAFAVRVETLAAAQAAWTLHRDASCAFQKAVFGADPVNVIAQAGCILEMTSERTFFLRAVPDMVK